MPTNRNTVTSIELRDLVGHVAEGRLLAAPEIQREDVGPEAGDGDDDEERDRHDLGDGRDGVERRRLLDAAQDQEMHAPQQDRGRGDGDRRRAVAEDREELAQRRLDQDEAGDVGEAAADPVADRRGKAEIVAEARLGVGVDAGIELGLAARQGLEDEGQHQHADAGDGPGDQRAQAAGRPAERRRQGEDARADHRAHDQGDERAQREFLFRREVTPASYGP